MHQFAGKSPDDKIKFLFKVYDIDGTKITFDIVIVFFIIIPIYSLFNLFYTERRWIDTASRVGTRDESLFGGKWNTI